MSYSYNEIKEEIEKRAAITKKEFDYIVQTDPEVRKWQARKVLNKAEKMKERQGGTIGGITGGSGGALAVSKSKMPVKYKIPIALGAAGIGALTGSEIGEGTFRKKYRGILDKTQDASRERAIASATRRLKSYDEYKKRMMSQG